MKLYILTGFLLLFSVTLTAQSYNTAFGLRMGTEWGFTAKQRIAKRTTLELIGQSSLQREEFTLTILAEQHYPILFRRFNVYLGGGFHKGWASTPPLQDGQFAYEPYEDPFGISLVMGAEMTLGRLNLSYDFKPAINIDGGQRNFYFQTGISLRYVIIKRRWKIFKKKINWRFWEK